MELTRKAIMDQTFALATQKRISRIKVNDIVTACGVTRNTFYYYFKDVFDVFEQAIADEVAKLTESREGEGTPDPEQAFFSIAEFVIRHKVVFKNLYDSFGHERMEMYLAHKMPSTVESYIRAEARGLDVDEQDIGILTVFYEEAVLGLLLRWLRGKMPPELSSANLKDAYGHIYNIFVGQVRTTLENLEKNKKQAETT